MNKRNRKKFEKRLQENRTWLTNHEPITPFDRMFEFSLEYMDLPGIEGASFANFMRVAFNHILPYVHL